MHNIYVKLTIDNKIAEGINYKELYDCKWDRMTRTNNILYTAEFTFLIIILAWWWPAQVENSRHYLKY